MTDTKDDVFIYRIDENDKIVFVSDNWSKFALDNDATETCIPPFVLSKPLWEFIGDDETIHLYQLVIDRIRTEKKTVKISINCDSPNLRRFMQITIKPFLENQIEFTSKVINKEKREYLPILNKDAPRTDEFVRICSYCKKIAVTENEWVETEEAIVFLKLFQKDKLPQLTHGVCPACYESVMSELR